jgi:hypothetical protein
MVLIFMLLVALPSSHEGPLPKSGGRQECSVEGSRRLNKTTKIHALVAITTLLLLVFSTVLQAQQPPEPKPLRFDFTPFAGYRTGMTFPIDPHVTGLNPRIVLEASPSYGVSFGVRLREEDLIEMRWARQDSYVHAEEIAPLPPRQHVVLNQFHGDFSHEYVVDEWVSWARPFAMLSVGGTHISGGTSINFTRFSFGIGGGIRFYASRHLGFKIQAEWVPLFVDPQVAFVCGGGCILHLGGTLSSQGEVLVGPLFRF